MSNPSTTPRPDCETRPDLIAELAALHAGEHDCPQMLTGVYPADWPTEAPWGKADEPWAHSVGEHFGDNEPCPTARLVVSLAEDLAECNALRERNETRQPRVVLPDLYRQLAESQAQRWGYTVEGLGEDRLESYLRERAEDHNLRSDVTFIAAALGVSHRTEVAWRGPNPAGGPRPASSRAADKTPGGPIALPLEAE